ncbi:hypothetical protein EB008_01540 [bacterium]|nr:hypothetical protein [bacterium]
MLLRELYFSEVESILDKWDIQNRQYSQTERGVGDKNITKEPLRLSISHAKLIVVATLGVVSSIALTIISYTARFTNKSNHGFKDWNEQEKVNLLDSYELLGHVTMSLISCEDAMGKLRVWYDRARSSPTQETL